MEDFELESKSYFFPNRLTLFEQVSQSLSRLISEKKWRPGEMLRCLMLAPARCGEL